MTAQDFAADAGGQYLEFFRRDSRSGVSLSAAVHRSTFRLMRQELLSPDGKVGLRAEYVYSGSDMLPQSVQLTLIGLSERTVRLVYSPARRLQAQFPFKVPGGYRDARELLRTMGVDI